ncbi:MAG: DUF4355 domain-containing protein [Clostridiaceae bacterium]|nr:DUF4355 domain-containing protein [Clostridiaceae bacterium]
MTFDEAKKAFEEFKGTDNYNNYIAGLMTDDSIQKYLDTDVGKKILQPILDKNFNKGLSTWQANNLSKLVDDEVKKRYPEKDEKDIELANLQAQLNALQQENTRKELLIKAQTIATEKKLPVDLVSYFIGKDEDETKNNLKSFEKAYTGAVGTAVDEKLKTNSHIPTDDKTEPLDGVTQKFMSLNPNLKIEG